MTGEIDVRNDKLIDKFFKNQNFKKILKNKKRLSEGDIFEYYSAWVFSGMSNNFEDYIVKIEKPGVKGNNGVDIIYPHTNENGDAVILVVQCKTGSDRTSGKSHNMYTIVERSNDLLIEVQKSTVTIEEIVKRWEISENCVRMLKNEEYRNRWVVKPIWLTEVPSGNANVKNDNGVYQWSIFDVFLLKHSKRKPSSNNIVNELEFKITNDFSENTSTAIVRENGKKSIESLVTAINTFDIYKLLVQLDKNSNLGYEVLFNDNVREGQGRTPISKSIEGSLRKTPKDFYYLNNGITLISNSISLQIDGLVKTFTIHGLKAINGQQTIRAIKHFFDTMNLDRNDEGKLITPSTTPSYILLRVYTNKTKDFMRRVSSATNSQMHIKPAEILATYSFNEPLQDELISYGIFYKYKTGDSEYSKQFKDWETVSLDTLIKYWYISVSGDVWAKNKLSKIMERLVDHTNADENDEIGKHALAFGKMTSTDNTEVFKTIADAYVRSKEAKKKNGEIPKLKFVQSLDMFIYLYMKDKTLYTPSKVAVFNNIVSGYVDKKIAEAKVRGEETDAANIFKTKKGSEELFIQLKQEFKIDNP